MRQGPRARAKRTHSRHRRRKHGPPRKMDKGIRPGSHLLSSQEMSGSLTTRWSLINFGPSGLRSGRSPPVRAASPNVRWKESGPPGRTRFGRSPRRPEPAGRRPGRGAPGRWDGRRAAGAFGTNGGARTPRTTRGAQFAGARARTGAGSNTRPALALVIRRSQWETRDKYSSQIQSHS
jgi:hypothetical protein